LATLAIVAAITAYLGWQRAALFRESFPSISVEITQECVWVDEAWTLLVLSARLKNTSQVLVNVESIDWKLVQIFPGTSDTVELFTPPADRLTFGDFTLEPQEEDVIFSEAWTPTPAAAQPVFAQLVVHCPQAKESESGGWVRRNYFILEKYNS
jgi:hypothetical protein